MNNSNARAALLMAGTAAAIIAGTVLAQPAISTALATSNNTNSSNTNATGDDSELTTFEEEALGTEENATTGDNMTGGRASLPAVTGDTIVLQGTVSSPGTQAGPFQIVDLVPPTLDGKVYVGWVSFTASKPVLVAPLHAYSVANEAIDQEFGELLVFRGTTDGTMIAPGITMPNYTTQAEINATLPVPATYSATMPFAASGLSVGRLDGEPFIVSYTVYATVYPALTVNDVEAARANQTEIPAANITIVSGSTFLNDTAYSPSPINVTEGSMVTWINDDFDSHTITSGTFGEDDVGDEFNSGYMGPKKRFSHTFEDTGEFRYFCELHPNMVGTVTVVR
jgi:plastocyanin